MATEAKTILLILIFLMRDIVQPEKSVLDQFEKIVSPIFDEVLQLTQKNSNLIKQRDLLLPRLMSGKLEV